MMICQFLAKNLLNDLLSGKLMIGVLSWFLKNLLGQPTDSGLIISKQLIGVLLGKLTVVWLALVHSI